MTASDMFQQTASCLHHRLAVTAGKTDGNFCVHGLDVHSKQSRALEHFLAGLAREDWSGGVNKGVLLEVAKADEFFRAIWTSVNDTFVLRVMHTFVVTLTEPLRLESFQANRAAEEFQIRVFRVLALGVLIQGLLFH